MTAHAPAQASRTRLHPLTPVLKGLRAFWLVILALSWQGLARFGLGWGSLIVLAGGLGALALSFLTWLVTGYEISGRELRIQEGLLVRRTRAVPLERLQSIEIVRGVLAQLTGLAELRLEVVGGKDSEVKLAFLPVAAANDLRAQLLALGGTRGEAGAEDAEARVLHQVPSRDLAISQLLTPAFLLSPFALAVPILLFLFEPNLTFVGIAGTVTAALGTLGAPVRRYLGFHGFTLAKVHDGLRISRGITEVRSQTVPPARVQSVTLARPLLWRSQDWYRCHLQVAGAAVITDTETYTGDTLVPVSTLDVALTALDEALPGAGEATRMPLAPAPAAALWRAPVAARGLGFGLTPEYFVSRSGVITPAIAVVPYGRIQAVTLDQGPWQRWLGLATVRVHTAGGGQVTAKYRTVAEANWLATELWGRAAAAR
ncbi:PH domain-containing protein [Longispora albida]|uniref:PH domain-containing protein n=1 Tax=Longispora albida TaxID=203523 RepID=UPI00036B029B|nr:PH domain-containing protein [Longispora albida]